MNLFFKAARLTNQLLATSLSFLGYPFIVSARPSSWRLAVTVQPVADSP